MSTLDINVSDDGATVIVGLSGEFDLGGLRDFHRTLTDLEARAPKVVRIDLRELAFIGATGLRSLLEVEARARREGFDLVIVKGPPPVQRVFEMTGVDQRLVVVDD